MTRLQTLIHLARVRKSPALAEYLDDAKPIGDAKTTPFQTVNSSWITGLRWTPEYGAEMSTKKGKHTYAYQGITKEIFRRWLARKSKGKGWWAYIGYPMRGVYGSAIHNSKWTGPTHPLFAHPEADGPVNVGSFAPGKRTELVAWLKSKVSPQATPEHLAALTGWLPGTILNYYWQNKKGNIPNTLVTEVSDPHGLYTAHRTIHGISNDNARPHIENDLMSIPRDAHSPYRGVSGSVLLRQIRAAYEMGIPSINWYSAYDDRGSAGSTSNQVSNILQQFFPALAALPQQPHANEDFTGGLTWPMMGADGILPPKYIKSVPREIVDEAQQMSRGRFISSQRISDFFTSPAARDYYREHPTSHDGFVDTTPGSYSRKAIEYHVGQNAVKRGYAPPIPDEQMPKKPLHLARRKHAPHIEHLLATGELHPDYFDEYFTAR